MAQMQEAMPQEQAGQGQDPQAQLGKIVQSVGKGLGMVAQAMQASGLPEQFTQRMSEIASAYEALIQEVSSGGEQGNTTATQEAGGAPGARPAM